MFKKNLKRFVVIGLILALALSSLAACDTSADYTITFDSNGGSKVTAITLADGAALTAPSAPTKAGYIFLGWYKDSKLAEKYEFPAKMPKESFTLYAKWGATELTVTYNTNGGSSVAGINAKPGDILDEPTAPTKENCIFGGWYTDNNTFLLPFTFIMPSASTTVYAKWNELKGKTDILATDWVVNNYDDTTKGYTTTKADGKLTVSTESDKAEWGYVYTGIAITNFQYMVVKISGTKDAVALLKFADADDDNEEETEVTLDGTEQIISKQLEGEGYYNRFILFINGGTEGTTASVTISEISLYKFEIREEYTLTFDSKGGSDVEPITIDDGRKITKPNNPTKDEVKFAGWFTDEATTIPFDFIMPKANTTVYAKWVAAPSDIIIAEEWVINDADTYVITQEPTKTTISSTETKTEWSYVSMVFQETFNTELYSTLEISLKGTAGKKIMFKLAGGVEKDIVFDGTVQTFTWDFKAGSYIELLAFIEGGIESSIATVEIYTVTFKNTPKATV